MVPIAAIATTLSELNSLFIHQSWQKYASAVTPTRDTRIEGSRCGASTRALDNLQFGPVNARGRKVNDDRLGDLLNDLTRFGVGIGNHDGRAIVGACA